MRLFANSSHLGPLRKLRHLSPPFTLKLLIEFNYFLAHFFLFFLGFADSISSATVVLPPPYLPSMPTSFIA